MAKEIYLQFTMEDGTIYSVKDANFGYCYKQTPDGLKKRVGRVTVEQAYEEYKDSEWGKQELEARKQAQEEQKKSDKAAEKKVNKPRKSKDIAYEGCGITLTSKQKYFLEQMPKDEFWEQGLDSALYNDIFTDSLEFGKIVAGAIISTLKEKGIILVGVSTVNGKKAKFFELTDLGKQVAKELGLN